MEKTDIRENHTDSSDHFAFESAIVESKLFRNVEYADLPPPNDDVAESDKISHRRRPIALKAGLGVTKADVADSKKPRERATRRKKIGESGRRHRPIQLKADVGVINKDAPETKSVKKKTSPEGKKPVKPKRDRRSIRLKGDDGIAKTSTTDTEKSQEKPVQSKKTNTPGTEKKTSVTAKTRKASPVRADALMPPAKTPVEIPSLDELEPLFSWVKSRQRLLVIIALSFTAGILVHSWLTPETPEPTKATESSQPDQQSATQAPALATPPTSRPTTAAEIYSQPTPANGSYQQPNQRYRDPSYDSARAQQRPYSQYPPQDRGEFNYPTRPQTPLSSTWRPPAGQPSTDNRYGVRQKYNPWTPREPQYSPYR